MPISPQVTTAVTAVRGNKNELFQYPIDIYTQTQKNE